MAVGKAHLGHSIVRVGDSDVGSAVVKLTLTAPPSSDDHVNLARIDFAPFHKHRLQGAIARFPSAKKTAAAKIIDTCCMLNRIKQNEAPKPAPGAPPTAWRRGSGLPWWHKTCHSPPWSPMTREDAWEQFPRLPYDRQQAKKASLGAQSGRKCCVMVWALM